MTFAWLETSVVFGKLAISLSCLSSEVRMGEAVCSLALLMELQPSNLASATNGKPGSMGSQTLPILKLLQTEWICWN